PLKRSHKFAFYTFIAYCYIELNFLVVPSQTINSNWILPEDLFYEKKGDYKSIAYFYYYVLKELSENKNNDYQPIPYLVTPLVKKSNLELEKESTYNSSQRNAMLTQYNRVRDLNDIKNRIKMTVPYHPPELNQAVFLVACKIDDRWIYTTGIQWIDSGIFNPEQCCYDYEPGGCYYSQITDDLQIQHRPTNPFLESEVYWKVFLEIQ
ncbi:MAG: hypothetical protein MJB14_07005, partial [Spirochaetes bacterium]|nr:hypothetical protein [Spirochaetota bacterium]